MGERKEEYVIDLLPIAEGKEYDYSYRIGKEFFTARENTEVLDSDVEVGLRVTRVRDTYKFEFSFDGELAWPCDRCLDPVKIEIGEDYEVLVRHGEEYDDSQEGLIVIPESWTRFDVSGIIYDTLLLAIPLRCVHEPGECNAEMTAALSRHEQGDDE
ncbi:MAG: YceD family protein [Muribaculaceae bacterium]|nr:YceD family protein [Muribaculaceae bacterium]